MKINGKTFALVAVTLVAGLLLGWLIFGSSDTNERDEHQHTAEVDDETIWTCSMHPQIRQSEPGDCPLCGMELIPLEGGESEVDTRAITMSPTAMQLANVSTAIVGTMEPVKTIRLNGKVQEDERLIFSQSSHISGRIEKLTINFTGEFVNKGQPIAYIYSPDLVTAQEELFEAYKIRGTHPRLYKAAREKLKNWKLTEGQIDRIIQSGDPREEFPVLADVSGYVARKMVNLGDYIQRGAALYEIANLSTVWVLFDVYEADIQWVNKGDEVLINIASLPGEEFTGKISFIDPVIDPQTRVAQARVAVKNKGMKLKPEMFASGIIEAELPKRSNAVVIPKGAVMWTGKRSVVYIKSTTGSAINFTMREVKLGPALGESFVIESGLEKGEEIAVHGTFSIDAAAQLAGKPSMMSPEGGTSMTAHEHGATLQTSASDSTERKQIPTSAGARKALKPVVQQYLAVKDALASDNLLEAKKAAERFKKVLSQINSALFTGPSLNRWLEYRSSLEQSLQLVANAQNIESSRSAFQSISEATIGVVKTFDPVVESLYIQHCPMAGSNKGADWLSLSEEIKNPYFGESMRSCGEVIQEIN